MHQEEQGRHLPDEHEVAPQDENELAEFLAQVVAEEGLDDSAEEVSG